LSFGLLLPFLLLRARTTFSAEHLLELLKNISKGRLLTTLSTLSLSKLFRETFKASEALSERTLTLAEWVLASEGVPLLLLLVSRHSRLIVYTPFTIVTQSFIRSVYSCELLFGFGGTVDIGMVLLGHLEISFLDVT